MKNLVLTIALCALVTAQDQDIFSTKLQLCNVTKDLTENYQSALYDFAVLTYKNIGSKSPDNLVVSPLSIWIILAAFAEGADPNTKQAMFQFLNLSNDPCVRLNYYQLATTRFVSSDSVNITSTRLLVINEGVAINPIYHKFVSQNSLLNVVSLPIRDNSSAVLEEMRRVTLASLSNVDLSGNSLLLDATDYNGLWQTAFDDAVVTRSPFYNQMGEHIGAIDLMKIKRKVKMAYVRSINTKFLEIPVGKEGNYRIIFGLPLDETYVGKAVKNFENTVLREYLSGLQETDIPIDIAIPRVNITSEHDIKKILEDLGAINLWKNPTITRNISKPAALPSGYVQRSTMLLNTNGVRPAPNTQQPFDNETTGLDPILGRDFITNKPFIFGLFDAETYTCIMASIFAHPTYPIAIK